MVVNKHLRGEDMKNVEIGIISLAVLLLISQIGFSQGFSYPEFAYNFTVPELNESTKQKIIESAQSYLNITQEPKSIEHDKELGIYKVLFQGEKTVISLTFDPRTLELVGYYNLNRGGDGIETYNRDQTLQIAENQLIKSVPVTYIDELFLAEEEKSTGYYIFVWDRQINNIEVSGEGFSTFVDYSNGNILSWSMRVGYPASEIDTVPTLTKDQAVYVIEKAYGITPIREPYLRIFGKRLVWETLIPGAFVALDTDTGETILFNPTKGSNQQQLPTHFNPIAYYRDTYGVYVIIVLIAIAGSATYLGRNKILPHLKK